MEQHFEFLRKHPIFESFTDEEIEQALVEFDYKIQSYKNDDIIFKFRVCFFILKY